ncbi:MAG: thioredoxin domain-containing protein [Desulfobacterales bacterium]
MQHHKEDPNRLIHEKSPYLLQHAQNPVDWYPWGEAAFEKARKEDKPILVSIGYSTCHWCHVMAAESFSDTGVAELMNSMFVCVKVDREERPDLDKVYITAVSALNGSAGWPLNVFLTPGDLKPFFGGTYFPKEPRPGMISWPELLVQIGNAWQNNSQREKIFRSAESVSAALKRYFTESQTQGPDEKSMDASLMDRAFAVYAANHDGRRGGFGNAPKFPSPSVINFLLFYSKFSEADNRRSDQGRAALDMACHTLRAMAKGGIHDHIGGGFHRYSVDADWHVPHFEKMLYDNAQLVRAYIEAFQAGGDESYLKIAEKTIDYVLRDLTHPGGAFFSAEDADSLPGFAASGKKEEKKEEGAYYVWEAEEVKSVLGQESFDIFAFLYGVRADGNVMSDPTGEFSGKNVLFAAHTVSEAAELFKKPESEIVSNRQQAHGKLFDHRAGRHRPHLDDKVITSWNGLMISALARAYQVTGNQRHKDAATKAAEFIYTNLYEKKSRQLFRIWRDGERKIPGLASDYSFLTQGLIDLYEADFNPRWLDWAITLAEEQIRLFFDDGKGGFYMTREGHDRNLLLRVKEESDNVLPSAGSVAAVSLLRLFNITGNVNFRESALKTIASAAFVMSMHPDFAPQMLVTLGTFLSRPVQIIIAGREKDADTENLLRAARGTFQPGKTILLVDGEDKRESLSGYLEIMKHIQLVNERPVAYVCFDHACREPVTDPAKLVELLEAANASASGIVHPV